MNETRRKPTTGRQSPSLFDKWHGIFYMPSRIDEAGHTKAFDFPVAEHWGESRNVQFCGWDSNRQHIGPESNALPTEPHTIFHLQLYFQGHTGESSVPGMTSMLHCNCSCSCHFVCKVFNTHFSEPYRGRLRNT